jgi:Zn-dependent peptidase ImmA (M78 family)
VKERIELNAEALRMRRSMGVDDASPLDIFSLIGQSDHLTLVLFPMGNRFSGMCARVSSLGLIAVNSRMSYGRQRLACAHELYHLTYSEECGRQVCLQDLDSGDVLEQEANLFSSFFLAPYEALHDYIHKRLQKRIGPLAVDDVVRIEQHFGISRRGILARLLREGYLTEDTATAMKSGMAEQAARLGLDPRLYAPADPDRAFFTMGQYIRLAENLKDKDIISRGKYEELMLAAFRADMVFGAEGDDPPDD